MYFFGRFSSKAFVLNGCKGVVIRENKLEEVCDKKMEFRQMKKKYIKVDF